MTDKIQLPRSLTAKMTYISILGLAAGLVVFLFVRFVGYNLVDRYYMSDSAINRRKAAIVSEFSTYISTNSISGHDTAAVTRWTQAHEDVMIVLINSERGNTSYFGAGQNGYKNSQSIPLTQFGRLYPVRFSDGQYQIAVSDTSDIARRQLVTIVSLLLAALTFIFGQGLYIRHLTKRIIHLSKEAGEVIAGDIENPITAVEKHGEDEVWALAQSMEEMRRSVIERMGNEQRAWQANSELITAISHDIRTPMTSMIGYLSLLSDSDFSDAGRARQFCQSAYKKAMELKDLTDELFRYFLVYGKAELELNLEEVDARMLLEQLICEAEFDLSDFGFSVERSDFEGEYSVKADPLYLKRVMDNIVSNIKKYADKSRPVKISSAVESDLLRIRVSNSVARNALRVESTKIGIRTCEKIMSAMGGSFSVESDSDSFCAVFCLPVQNTAAR